MTGRDVGSRAQRAGGGSFAVFKPCISVAIRIIRAPTASKKKGVAPG